MAPIRLKVNKFYGLSSMVYELQCIGWEIVVSHGAHRAVACGERGRVLAQASSRPTAGPLCSDLYAQNIRLQHRTR